MLALLAIVLKPYWRRREVLARPNTQYGFPEPNQTVLSCYSVGRTSYTPVSLGYTLSMQPTVHTNVFMDQTQSVIARSIQDRALPRRRLSGIIPHRTSVSKLLPQRMVFVQG